MAKKKRGKKKEKGWKNWPYWLKWGLAGGITGSLINVISYLQFGETPKEHFILQEISISLLIFIIYFIMGVFVGLIIHKILLKD